MQNLKGKVAVVTGCGKGIGEAIVKKFLEEEIDGVAMLEYDEDLCRETAARLDPTGKRAVPIRCDVSDGAQVQEAIDKTMKTFGKIDILVNNAGITRDAMFHKMTEQQWDQVINVNLKSMFHTCKSVIPLMREAGYGKIVNISSIAYMGNIGQANYSASKAAIIGLSKTLAKENGPKNICVNVIAPGFINTDMIKTVPEVIQNGWKKEVPLQRFAETSEIAAAVCFLAGDESSYITGQCIHVSGGKSF